MPLSSYFAGNSRRRGFVLLMVLVVLALAGTILASSARTHCERVLEAGRLQRELQVRWGSLSCRSVFLPAAGRILMQESASGGSPRTGVGRSLTLGGMKFHVFVSDEQAKANVNTIQHLVGRRSLESSLRRLQAGTRRPLHVELRPSPPPKGLISNAPMVYSSFERLFVVGHPSELIDPEAPGDGIMVKATCWGSGLVNFKRAEPDVMREAAAGTLTESEIARLVQFRGEEPDCTLEEAISDLEQTLQLPEERAAKLRTALTDISLCHSLWIVAEGPTRSWYRLCVRQLGDAANDSQQWTLVW